MKDCAIDKQPCSRQHAGAYTPSDVGAMLSVAPAADDPQADLTGKEKKAYLLLIFCEQLGELLVGGLLDVNISTCGATQAW